MMLSSYSNQDFDVAQGVASVLTDEDRELAKWSGADVPRYGYSHENFELAAACIKHLDGPMDFARVLREAQDRRAELNVGMSATVAVSNSALDYIAAARAAAPAETLPDTLTDAERDAAMASR